jgi:hypothetical protein
VSTAASTVTVQPRAASYFVASKDNRIQGVGCNFDWRGHDPTPDQCLEKLLIPDKGFRDSVDPRTLASVTKMLTEACLTSL